MPNINYIEWIGYGASVLVAISLLMSSIIKLRWYNLVGSILFSIYGFTIGAYPVGIINSIIVIVNIYYLFKLYNKKDSYKLLEVTGSDQYLKSFCTYYYEDVKKYFPDFKEDFGKNTVAFAVLRNMVMAGVLIGERVDESVFSIKLDYVIPEYRDFKIGRYIYAESRSFFLNKGYKSFSTSANNESYYKYFKSMGFAETEKDGVKYLSKEI